MISKNYSSNNLFYIKRSSDWSNNSMILSYQETVCKINSSQNDSLLSEKANEIEIKLSNASIYW